MNIFYVDHDPTLAAQALCDRHVVKMILDKTGATKMVARIC